MIARLIRSTTLAGCALLSTLSAPSLLAQTPSALPWFQRGTVMIGAEVGGAAFTDFQRTMARPTADGVVMRDFERRVSATTSPSFGGWVGVWLNDRWGLRGGAAFTPSAFSVRNDELTMASGRAVPAAETDYAGLHVLLADVSVLYRLPVTFGRVVPYALAGGGIVRYWRSGDGDVPAEARDRFNSGTWTGPAGVLGIGSVIPLQKRDLMLVFELTDHLSSTPLGGAGFSETVDGTGVQLQFEPNGTESSNRVAIVNNLRLMVGVVLPIR